MPPKQKYTRESILTTALQIAKRDGLSAVVARNVGNELGCTVSPIFSYFKNMEDLQQAVVDEAITFFKSSFSETVDYKTYCLKLIEFAKDDPKLFDIVFASRNTKTELDILINEFCPNLESVIDSLTSMFEMSSEEALAAFKRLWINAYGVASLISFNVLDVSNEEIDTIIERFCAGEALLARNERAEALKNASTSASEGIQRASARSVIKVSVKQK